ncbi:S8 family peptidase [Aliikangiella coralliicola]|nr:S8 family peptidase [Aliikangiella coralliicola]
MTFINKKKILVGGLSLISVMVGNALAQTPSPIDEGITFETSAADVAMNAAVNNAVTDQIIVKYKENGLSTLNSQMAQTTQNVVSRWSANIGRQLNAKMVKKTPHGAGVFKLDKSLSQSDLNSLIGELQADSNVLYAEPDLKMYPLATPNDTHYNLQWHYYEATGGMNMPAAWDVTQGEGVVVAVLDTGYRPHVDLNANILPGYDMITDVATANDGNGRDSDARDPGDATTTGECGNDQNGNPLPARNSSWHGTHVAGTIAAVTNNSSGVAGVAYKSKVVPVRVLGKCGGYTSDIAAGIVWASGGSVSGVPANANPAKVINMSLGGGGSCNTTYQNAINTARNNGATVVVAAGNSNANAANFTPASCPGVINVAATNRAGGRSYYSNYGASIDVAAPGGELTQTTSSNGVLSTLNSGTNGPANDNYSYSQGTSMAAPHVAGAAALLYAVKPNITPTEVENALKNTARSFPSTCSQCGSGIVDAKAAIDSVSGGGGGNPPGGNELANGVAKTGLQGAQGAELRYTFSVPAGATNLKFAMSGGSGDADLYVRFGSQPTTGTYDCRPWKGGNTENCDISNVQAGTYHVMVRGYSSFSGVSLTASYTENSGGGNNGGTANYNSLSGSQGAWKHHQITIPAGMSSLVVNMSGGSGDADLYVRQSSQPTLSSYNCRPWKNGNTETCTISNPAAGTWYVSVYGYRTYSGANVSVEWKP